MKREEFDRSIETMKELYFKDGKCYDIIYLCSDELYDEELGFRFSLDTPKVDYKVSINDLGENNLYVIVTKQEELRGVNEFKLVPREPKPIRIIFE